MCKKKKKKRVIGVGRKTREETEKWNYDGPEIPMLVVEFLLRSGSPKHVLSLMILLLFSSLCVSMFCVFTSSIQDIIFSSFLKNETGMYAYI